MRATAVCWPSGGCAHSLRCTQHAARHALTWDVCSAPVGTQHADARVGVTQPVGVGRHYTARGSDAHGDEAGRARWRPPRGERAVGVWQRASGRRAAHLRHACHRRRPRTFRGARENAARGARRSRDARGARRRRARARAAAATPAGAPPRAGGRRSLRLRSSARVRAAGTQVPARCARCGTRGGQYFFAYDLFCALTCLHRGHARRGAPYQRRRATFAATSDTHILLPQRRTHHVHQHHKHSRASRFAGRSHRSPRGTYETSYRSLCSSCPRPRLLRASVVARSLCVGGVGAQPFVCNTRRLFRGGSPPSCLDAARRVQPCVRCTDALGRQRFISSQPASYAGRRRRCCSRRMPCRIRRRPLGVC